MLDIMGQVTTAMLRRYYYIRAQARREAITAREARFSIGFLQESPKVSVESVKTTSVTH